MSEVARVSQLDARQLLYDYVDGLWADITRAGMAPNRDIGYHIVATTQHP